MRDQGVEAFRFAPPLVPAVHDAVELCDQKLVRLARFTFRCTQFSSSTRNSANSRRMAGTGSDASGASGDGNMRTKEWTLAAEDDAGMGERLPKHGLQTVNANTGRGPDPAGKAKDGGSATVPGYGASLARGPFRDVAAAYLRATGPDPLYS